MLALALTQPVAPSTQFINEGQVLLNVVIGVVLPLLVALVTHRVAAEWLKSLILLALSVLGGLLTTVTVASFDWKDFLLAFAVQFGSAVASHFGALKPLGITGSTGAIQNTVPQGIGGSTTSTKNSNGQQV